jgi:prepilin-type N-terminal cleavage/methylation domain-containing protein
MNRMASSSHSPLNARGFTLIEILVVIAIIGLLSSIILASLNSARIKGNDSARIQNIKSLETAMEFYYDSHAGTYPPVGNPNASSLLSDARFTTVGAPNTLIPTYIGVMPQRLIDDQDFYVYDTNAYGLLVKLEANGGSWCKTGVNVKASWWSTIPGITNCTF